MRSLFVVVAIVAGCNLSQSLDAGDPPLPEGSVDAEREDGRRTDGGDADGDEEVDWERSGGPLTYVISAVAVVEERLCDLDGDGTFDSAVADLGPAHAPLFSAAMSVAFQGRIEAGDVSFVLHFPWIDDIQTPQDTDAWVIVAHGEDTDEPPDPTDSFSGDEPIYISRQSLDDCGEPLYAFGGVQILDGEATMAFEDTLEIPGANWKAFVQRAQGTIEQGGREGTFLLCTYVTLQELGSARGLGEGGELSMLELVIAGGAALGLPTLPGLSPDVDLDGDGLERIVLDEAGQVESCIDGDSTEVWGRECFTDPRIADAVSFNIRLLAVSAVFAGLNPHGERLCDDPPEESMWDRR